VCRHIAHLGPPRPLADLVIDRPHSLLRQSWAPCDMRRGGTINADGFGVGWYPAAGAEPLRYRRDVPMWTDANLDGIVRSVVSGAVLAAVRSATVGMPVIETASAPFRWERWLFSHNGVVAGWPGSLAGAAAALPVTDLLTLDAPTDSALLFAMVRHRIRAGVPPQDAVADVVTEVAALAPDSRLNLLLTDGDVIIGTAWYHSLSVRTGDGEVTVASEPWDDDEAWRPVPDRHLVVATRSGVRTRPLTLAGLS
jgi:glutamine amidotransferase